MQRQSVQFIFRGAKIHVDDFAPGKTLLDWLRRDQRACGVKEGCAEGDCGACTVILRRLRDGDVEWLPVNACILLLGQADGAEILTVEDLAAGGVLHPVQDALVRHHGSQCGFCTPGIAMSLAALHGAQEDIQRSDIVDALAGNLCRCTGYRPIVEAMLEAARTPPSQAYAQAREKSDALLHAMQNDDDICVGDESSFFAAPAREETLVRLAAAHPDAIFVGGATDFGLRVTKELFEPQKLIWLGRVSALQTIEYRADAIVIGAGVTVARTMGALGALHEDIALLLRRFGSRQVRASGTIGGNIANGSPVGDLPPVLMALGAEIELQRGPDRRRLPLEKFFLAYKKQDRAPGEYVRAIHVPLLRSHEKFRAMKLSKRFDEDISAVCMAVKIAESDGAIAEARIAYGAMAGTPARARRTEKALLGLPLHQETAWQASLMKLDEDFSPLTDQRASAEYRRLTARNLLYKALLEMAGVTDATRLPQQAAE